MNPFEEMPLWPGVAIDTWMSAGYPEVHIDRKADGTRERLFCLSPEQAMELGCRLIVLAGMAASKERAND